jgi:hypothetical protein
MFCSPLPVQFGVVAVRRAVQTSDVGTHRPTWRSVSRNCCLVHILLLQRERELEVGCIVVVLRVAFTDSEGAVNNSGSRQGPLSLYRQTFSVAVMLGSIACSSDMTGFTDSAAQTALGILREYPRNIPSAVCGAAPEDEQVMLETCRGP